MHNVLLLAHIPLPSSSATLQAVLCVHGITTHEHSGPTCEQRVLTNVSRLEIPFKGKKSELLQNPSYFKIVHSEEKNQDTKQIAHRHWQASKHTPTHLLTFCVTLSHDQES